MQVLCIKCGLCGAIILSSPKLFVTLSEYRHISKRVLSVIFDNLVQYVDMESIEIIKCHGSGNDFVMVDTTALACAASVDWALFARMASAREGGIGSDGILLVVRHEDGVYGMDMFNPDGTRAEMCGNGIRCVARLAIERGYISHKGILRSGGRDYVVQSTDDIAEGVKCFMVDIPIRTWSSDFSFFADGESFVGRKIEALDAGLQFTALNLGNPHIVAAVEHIDMEQLSRLGAMVKDSAVGRELFPHGVNVSLYERRAHNSLFVATYERGAGITLSCGTAMTASGTAAALLHLVEAGSRVEVCNRGGKVYCCTSIDSSGIVTRLEGNATFDWWGRASLQEGVFGYEVVRRTSEEAAWQNFVKSVVTDL